MGVEEVLSECIRVDEILKERTDVFDLGTTLSKTKVLDPWEVGKAFISRQLGKAKPSSGPSTSDQCT